MWSRVYLQKLRARRSLLLRDDQHSRIYRKMYNRLPFYLTVFAVTKSDSHFAGSLDTVLKQPDLTPLAFHSPSERPTDGADL